MASASDYLEKKLLDHSLAVAAYTMPTTIYVALYTVAPTDAGGGTEPSAGGYARKSVTFGAATGTTATSVNTTAPTWTASGGNYGELKAVGLFDAVSGGNLLYWAPLSVYKTVNDGDTLTINASTISLTLT